jgi:hypothetical protein
MGRPRIDERYILAGRHHMGARIPADRAGADDGDFLAGHLFCSLCRVPRAYRAALGDQGRFLSASAAELC